MRKDLQISGGWTRMVLGAFEVLGLDTKALCAAVGVDHAWLNDAGSRVPRDLSGRLWREAQRMSGDGEIGIHAGEAIRGAANSLLTHMVLTSPTLLEGLERSLPYQRVLAHGRVASLEKRRGAWALRFGKVAGDLPITRAEIEFMMLALLRMMRFAVRGSWQPLAVRFEFPVPSSTATAEYERAFGCRVEFAKNENSILLPEDVMTRPLPLQAPAVLDALETAAREAVDSLAQTNVAGEVRSRLLARMRARRAGCTVQTIAAEMHVGERTLQRRLRVEGTSFKSVLEEAQRDRCLELLGGPASLAQIGAAVGLSGSRALARAFKRWTGRTPAEHRRLGRHAAEES